MKGKIVLSALLFCGYTVPTFCFSASGMLSATADALLEFTKQSVVDSPGKISELNKQGARVNARDDSDKTALHYFVEGYDPTRSFSQKVSSGSGFCNPKCEKSEKKIWTFQLTRLPQNS